MKIGSFVLDATSTSCCSEDGFALAPGPSHSSPSPGRSLALDPRHSRLVGPPRRKNSKNKKGKLSVAVVGIFLADLMFLFVCCKLLQKIGDHRAARKKMGSGRPENGDREDDESLFFSFTRIEIATNHFSNQNKLGQGGFGPVYKGRLEDGLEIAVKRLNRMSRHGIEQFKNEVTVISELQHKYSKNRS